MRTIFFGSGTFALPAMERLHGSDLAHVGLVVTAPPRVAGRKGQVRPTAVAAAAEQLGIPIATPARLREASTLEALAAEEAGLIVLADYGRLIPPAVLEMAAHGALNLHPSLLPRHRGATPVAAAILAGDARTGVTLMRMDQGLDTGPVIAQREVPLDGTEVAPKLEARLADIGAELLIDSLPGWISGALPARPQPADGASLTKPLRRSDGRLDPTRPARQLERQIRAFQPWPGSFLEIGDERLIVWSGAIGEGATTAEVGALIPSGDGLALVTADGRLELTEVQPSSKRPMSGAEYRRGRRI